MDEKPISLLRIDMNVFTTKKQPGSFQAVVQYANDPFSF
ncbi:hypothetical protein ABID47_006371 [Paenibacillus favisporus]|uniref:Uncharacterized protein n=1 Tax=Paenibacillus favisporus TaxID=221028 RepID=A0ABV2FDE2_9BACL